MLGLGMDAITAAEPPVMARGARASTDMQKVRVSANFHTKGSVPLFLKLDLLGRVKTRTIELADYEVPLR